VSKIVLNPINRFHVQVNCNLLLFTNSPSDDSVHFTHPDITPEEVVRHVFHLSNSNLRSRGSIGRSIWRRRFTFLARWAGFGRPGHGASGSSWGNTSLMKADAGVTNFTSASLRIRETNFAATSVPTCPLWLCCNIYLWSHHALPMCSVDTLPVDVVCIRHCRRAFVFFLGGFEVFEHEYPGSILHIFWYFKMSKVITCILEVHKSQIITVFFPSRCFSLFKWCSWVIMSRAKHYKFWFSYQWNNPQRAFVTFVSRT